MKKYMREDGTITGWISSPENETDREIITLMPLRRKYSKGEIIPHKKLGSLECINCERLVNTDQIPDWGGPAFCGEFVLS